MRAYIEAVAIIAATLATMATIGCAISAAPILAVPVIGAAILGIIAIVAWSMSTED